MANLPRQMSTLNVDTLHFTARAAGRGQYIKQQLLAKGQSYFCQCKSNNSALNGVSCMFIMPCLTSQIISYDICLFCALWTLLCLFLSLSLRLSFSTSVTCQIIVEYYYVLLLLLLFFSGIDLMRQCCHVIARQTVERAKRSVFMRSAAATATRRMSNVPKVDLWNHSNISN